MSKSQPIEDIVAGWDSYPRPMDGQRFRHYKGGEYIIVATGFMEETEIPAVVYRSLTKGIIWVRSAKNFFEEVEHHDVLRPRFLRVKEE
ncbi:MAG: DUF1653 domain-containing protein [Candidatus Saccharimonadales bacterium]